LHQMKKQKIIFIAFLMGFALLGLILLQINWISQDIDLRRQKFDDKVQEALINAASELETGESLSIISKSFQHDFADSVESVFQHHEWKSLNDSVLMELTTINEEVSELDDLPDPEEIVEKGTNSTSVWIKKSSDDSTANVTIKLKAGNHASASATFPDGEESEVSIDQKSGKQQLIISTDKVKLKLGRVEKVIRKMAIELGQKDFILSDRVKPETIDSVIADELNKAGISIPYGISVINGVTDSVIWSRGEINDESKIYDALLFPGDIVNRNDRVEVRFPDAFSYLISSMWLMLLGSGLFTLIVIVAFSYTIYIIFRQKKLDDIRSDFINNMTHEFKTPIATIRLAADALTNKEVADDPVKVSYFTSIIKDENERMNNHVENILQMAIFDKRAFIPDLMNVDLHEFLKDAVAKMKVQFEEKGGVIKVDFKASRSSILADRTFFPVVILNLLDNALKYCDQVPVVDVVTEADDSSVTFIVKDNGIGMSPDTMAKIFDKFYRVPTGNLHQVKGFGLGLNYVKAIVTAHNGIIRVTSEPGKGSSFYVTMPLAGK
jgi:two-component system, OmpR family, phosphate regulon sensor histidine kinase PhoR